MCILAFAWRAHPRWHLIVAGNRDELHARPAAPLARWDGPGHILAGRDLQSGGTWLGVSEEGRFAIVTNLRGHGGPEPDRASRGALVTDLLAGAGRYADPERAALLDFNPFNLIFADGAGAHFLSNRPETIRTRLGKGVYGLSNGALDEPWPKTLQLKAAMLEWIVAGAAEPEFLFEALRSEGPPEGGLAPSEPSEVPQEPAQSSIFIRDPIYGTRCSTVVAIDGDGKGMVMERRFDPAGMMTGETRLDFAWPSVL